MVTRAEHEIEEVRRAFEKHGFADLLVDAQGKVSPHIGVLRLLAFIARHNLDAELLLLLRKDPTMASTPIEILDKDRERYATMSLEEASAELSRRVYEAAILFERLEGAGKVFGNGHHAAQKLAAFAVDDLKARWLPKS